MEWNSFKELRFYFRSGTIGKWQQITQILNLAELFVSLDLLIHCWEAKSCQEQGPWRLVSGRREWTNVHQW